MHLPSPGTSSASDFSDAVHRWFPTPQFLLPRACGVDISDSSIKWMLFSPGQERQRRVASWGELPLHSGIVVGGVVHDVHALGDALKEIRPHMGPIKAAHAALPEEAAYVFSMHVPERSERTQVLSMIEFEFDGRVPIPPASAVYDYNAISARDEREREGEEICVVVFPREIAESYAQAFQLADIELFSLEVEARSIARAVSSSAADEPITLLVDFGRARTGFAVVRRGMPIFTSTVEVGGEPLMQALQRTFSLSRDQAETFSNERGLRAQGEEKKGADAIIPTVSALADEVARHYRYWDTRRNELGERVTPVGKVVLVGGSANVMGLPEYIAGRVQANVSVGNIWRHVCDFDAYVPPIGSRISLQYATAVGLALRGFEE